MNFGKGTAQFRSPKTVLGFFAVLIAILASGAVFAIGIFARVPELHGFIAPILVFVGTVIVVTLIGVFVTAWKDPTILMLGQMSGEVYVEYRRQLLGDSTSGEYLEKNPVAIPHSPAVPQIQNKLEDQTPTVTL